MNKKLIIALVVGLLLLALPMTAAFAQTDTLAIDGTTITSGLFQGANIVISALASVVFLIVGISFGALVLRSIASMIMNMRFF